MLTGRLIEAKTMFYCLCWDPQDPRSVITQAMVSRSFRVCINKQARSQGATLPLSLHLVLGNSEPSAGFCLMARHSPDWSQVGIINYFWPVLALVCSIHCTSGQNPGCAETVRIFGPLCTAHHVTTWGSLGWERRGAVNVNILISRISPRLWRQWWEERRRWRNPVSRPFPGPSVQWWPLNKLVTWDAGS